MPKLQDPRREAFAQLVAEGRSRTAAYLEAGFAAKSRRGATASGVRLYREPAIRARIGELELVQHKREGGQRQDVLDKLWANVHKAVELKQLPAANRALELVGRSLGMFVERVAFENSDDVLAGMTDAELQAYLRGLIVDLGLAPVGMSDTDLRTFILRNAERAGLVVTEKGAAENGAGGDAEAARPH